MRQKIQRRQTLTQFFLNWIIFTALTACFFGCLGNTHHLNSGRILKPGEYQKSVALGIGKVGLCNGNTEKIKGKNTCIVENSTAGNDFKKTSDISWESIPSISYQWRIGMWENWGILKGVDMGYSLEIPHTWEFDARLGLPTFTGMQSSYINLQHNIGLGWGLGYWADNTWYLEYALGTKFHQSFNLYLNYRFNILATQFADLSRSNDNTRNKGEIQSSNDDFFQHHRRILHQLNTGLELHFPFRNFVAPNYFHLAYHLGYPVLLLDGNTAPKSGVKYLFNSKIIFAFQWTHRDF